MARRPRFAPRGQRTIRLTIALWADDIVEGKGMILPGHAWDTGAVYMVRNESHRIMKPRKPEPFGDSRSLDELPGVVRRILRRHGVTLHRDRRSN
jgi:hypothetical protein